MTRLSSKRSATLRRMLRISSSGKSTDRVSCPDASLPLLAATPGAFGATSCLTAPSSLAGWWPGDGNANDIAGANNGALQGGATATLAGEVGQAFNFDGTNSFVQIPDSPALRPTNLTIEAWVRFTSLDSAVTRSRWVRMTL